MLFFDCKKSLEIALPDSISFWAKLFELGNVFFAFLGDFSKFQSYVEGSSLSGYYLLDYVVAGDEIQDYYDGKSTLTEQAIEHLITDEETKFAFGCTTKETNLFYTQEAAGIMGMGTRTNSKRPSFF